MFQSNTTKPSFSGIEEDPVMPIAIIGFSGRFPGDAENPTKLWDMIAAGKSALSDIPKDRFNVDAYYHPHHERHGILNVRKAHFMKRDISAFDAPFFTMSIPEAEAMDPQQRMALECTYEALENAGLRMEDVSGSSTSCFVGCFTRDYSEMLGSDPEDLPLYHGTGTGSAIMSNRISWFFDFKGPSISLDTACSSSMAALHLGCQSLRTGETTMSIVGGTNLILMPGIMGSMTRLHFLSPDGKCQSFDHKGNGYSRGEGAGFCVLKPLDLALKDGDVIRGVIRNSAVSQDGHTPGITLPSGDAQEALIRRVYAEAGLGLADTAYVEAHGTGTPAGDPVEAGALGRTFGSARDTGNPLIMGSIKSNIGHLEGGSGMVQVIKGIMMIEKGEIPPSIWYEKPNPRIPMEEWNLQVATQLMPWPTAGLRRVSINSFGYGGTNAHCIIDDAYHYFQSHRITGKHSVQAIESASPMGTPDSGVDLSSNRSDTMSWTSVSEYFSNPFASEMPSCPKLLLWSSNDQGGVERNANAFAQYLKDKVSDDLTEKEEKRLLAKLAITLANRRSVLPWKSFAVASSCKEAIAQFESLPAQPVRTSSGRTCPKLAFVFTGQGAQWFAMGRELYAQPVFRASLEAAGRYFVTLGAYWSLLNELFRDEETSRLDSPDLCQPLCTALQIALVDLFKSWGIKPTAVIGHSSGEIAAAYAKGGICREDAWKIAYYRGHLSSCIRGFAPNLHGSMLATGLGAEDSQKYISRLPQGNATVACMNSPASTTISGDSIAIDELEQMIKRDGHFARKLRVDIAYHSPHMQVIAEKYRQALGDIIPLDATETQVQMFSSLTSERVKTNSELGTDYWVSNLICPVSFSNAMTSLLQYSEKKSRRRNNRAFVEHLIEFGPHAALKGPIKQILISDSVGSLGEMSYQSVLERGKNACETAMAVAGRLFQNGYPVTGDSLFDDLDSSVKGGYLVDMPPFEWNHSLKYWADHHTARHHRFRKNPRTDLLGVETVDGIDAEPRFRNILRNNDIPWAQLHKVQGAALYPGAGMMIMAIEAMCQRADPLRPIAGYELRDIIISKAIVVPTDESGIETMLNVRPYRQGTQSLDAAWQEFQLYSRKDTWELNCSGLIRIDYKTSPNTVFVDEGGLAAERYASQYQAVQNACSRLQSPRDFYEQLNSIGLYYGGVFQALTEIRKGDYCGTCQVKVSDTKSIMPHQFEFPHVIHPVTLDSIFQMAVPSSLKADEDLNAPRVPVGIGRLYISADVPKSPGDILNGYATYKQTGFDQGESNIVVSGEQWDKPLVVLEGMRGRRLNTKTSNDTDLRKIGSHFHWQEDLSLMRPEQLRKLCVSATGHVKKENRQVLIDIEMACMVIIKRVMQECSVEESESYAWNFKLFYDYMRDYMGLAKAGSLGYQLETPGVDWLNMTPEAEEFLLKRVSKTSTDGRVLIEHGKHLPQILRGEIPPLQILMSDNFLHDFYQSGIGTKQHYAQMTWYVDQLAHKNPDMKILEIGGGTAAAALPVLQTLGGSGGTEPRFESYTFTDISVGYFEKAQRKLAPWVPYMNFAKLNIEEDPVTQGFEEGGYDMIVASNVLHATRSIGKTLQNARKLLKPNGKLVLSELTQFQKMRFHMVVGSLEGWWYGEDDGRHHGPTLSMDQWNDALLQAGFDGIEVDFKDFPDPRDTGFSVMISGASASEKPLAPKEVIIVLPANPESDVINASEEMKARLQERGSLVLTASLQDTLVLDLQEKSCLCLLDANQGNAFLPAISSEDWDALKHLILTTQNITYVTRGGAVNSENPKSNLMSGLARSIRSENYHLSFTTLDAEYGRHLADEEALTAMLEVFCHASHTKHSDRPDWEYAIRNGMPMIQRVLLEKGINDLSSSWYAAPAPEQAPFKQDGRSLSLGIGTLGRLETLRFEDDRVAAEPLGADDVEITVRAAGLNSQDLMVAMGQLSKPGLGVDCAGIIRRVGRNVKILEPGTPVMTWKMGTFGNIARAPAAMVQRVPDGMDLTTAASLPLIYSAALYSLSTVARLKPGETILIHGAAGGIGQAAIMLAQSIGATVLVTVSSEAKKALLTTTYGIPESHVLNSRDDSSFVQGVMRLTNNRGVDVVLNSLAGEALRTSWGAISRFGRFIELGHRDIAGNTGLDMAPFLRNVSFHSVNMLDLLDWDVATASRVFADAVDLLRRQVVKPIAPVQAMPFSRVEEAFRLLQTGEHTGKLVLEAHDDDLVSVVPAAAAPVRFRSDATYLIAGGGGGLGRAIALWMVGNGARNILLLSRSGTKKAAAKDLVSRLTAQGARVEAWPCDVSNEEQVAGVIERCRLESWPQVRGVIQGAMDLQDALYQNMTHEQFTGALLPKVNGTWNLHKHLPEDMDFYILLSSVIGIAGSPCQGNYSAGNTYQDAIAHYRRSKGMAACCIDVGMMLGVGYIAEQGGEGRVHDNAKAWSFLGIHEHEFIGILEATIRGESTPGSVVPPQVITGLGTGGMLTQMGEKYPWWFKEMKFGHIKRVGAHQQSNKSSGKDEISVSTLLGKCQSLDEASDIVTEALVKKLAKSMVVSAEDIEPSKPVSSYGVDSLLAVELRNWIYADIKAEVSVFDLLSSVPITSLAGKIAGTSEMVPKFSDE